MEHHNLFSPSSFPALSKCPCFLNLIYDKKDKYAEVGTNKHELFNKIFSDGFKDIKDDDVLWSYEKCTELSVEFFGNEYATIKEFPEEKVTVYDDNLEELYFGTSDLIVTSKTKALLFDVKYGQERDYSMQMCAYARGIMDRFGFEEITCFVIYGKLKKYISYKFTYNESISIINKIINSVKDENKKPSRCDYCKYCSNISLCEESKVLVNALVEQVGPQVKNKKLVPIDNNSVITDTKTIGELLDLCRTIIKPWCDTIEYIAKQSAESGKIPDGFKQQTSRGKRFVNDIVGLFDNVGLSQKEFLECCSVNLSSLENKLHTTKKEFNKIVDNYCLRGQSTKRLIKETEQESDE